jgi:hypothetical protein
MFTSWGADPKEIEMSLSGMTKIGAIAAVLATALAAAAPASAEMYRANFGDRDGASMRIVVRDHQRDFRDRHEMLRREAFVHQARFHHYGWHWRQHGRDFRY